MSRSSPAAFPNVGAGAGISTGPDYVSKTTFDNIASGTGTGIGKAGVCESALRPTWFPNIIWQHNHPSHIRLVRMNV